MYIDIHTLTLRGNFMKFLWAYILVFIFAAAPFFEAYAVVPLASVAGLAVLPVMILGLIGNILTVSLVILFINQIKNWRKKRKKDEGNKRNVRAQNLWNKYGLPGLAMFGPLLVGSHLTALASMSFGGHKKENTSMDVSQYHYLEYCLYSFIIFRSRLSRIGGSCRH